MRLRSEKNLVLSSSPRTALTFAALIWFGMALEVRAQNGVRDVSSKGRGEYAIAGPRIGDTVVVIKDTQKHQTSGVIGAAEMGQRFNVQAVNNTWLWPDYAKPGWIPQADVLPVEKAHGYFTRLIGQNPTDPKVYRARGSVAMAREDWDQAIEDLNAAIRLAPTDDFCYRERGMAWHQKGDYDRALADFNQAIRLNPRSPLYFMNRGAVYENKRDFSRALADFNTALQVDPQNAGAHNNRAYLLAACPENAWRNGPAALRDATEACRISSWSNYTYLGTLAAVHAELGDFSESVRWQTRALELAPAAKKPQWQARLELYQAGKPYRETGKW